MTQESIETAEAASELIAILQRAFIPRQVIDDLLVFGLTTPNQAYSFLLNTPSLPDPKVQAQLGIDWTKYGPEDVWSTIIAVLRKSGALSPEFLDLQLRQTARAYDAPLAALGPLGPIGDLQEREATAAAYVAAVEQSNKKNPVVRSLPNEKLDLREKLVWPVRDQRPWPSCMGFAVAAGLELQMARKGKKPAPDRLSARFLYRLGRGDVVASPKILQPAYQGGGLKQADVAEVLKNYGAAPESLCRDYLEKADIADSVEEWKKVVHPISQAAKNAAKKNKPTLTGDDYPDYTKRPPGLARKTFLWLKQGRAVVVSLAGSADPKMPNGNIWHAENFWNTGGLRVPEPHHIVGLAGHAVCVVGYLPKVPGLTSAQYPGYIDNTKLPGFFLFRNSWGVEYFARNSPLAPQPGGDWDFPRGYGLIPAAVVEYFAWELGVLG
jgi:hypothetical protein